MKSLSHATVLDENKVHIYDAQGSAPVRSPYVTVRKLPDSTVRVHHIGPYNVGGAIWEPLSTTCTMLVTESTLKVDL